MDCPRTKREAYKNTMITPLIPPPRPPSSSSTPPSPSTSRSTPSPPLPHNRSSSSLETSENDELQKLVHTMPPKRKLTKQFSMCETARDRAWERRRRQTLKQQLQERGNVTDGDMEELKGSIELGFGFKEAAEGEGEKLCNTLPALDLYFAVNRQVSPNSEFSMPGMGTRSASFDSFRKSTDDPWMICSPGDNPQQVKTKLRHWAQAVACSLMESVDP